MCGSEYTLVQPDQLEHPGDEYTLVQPDQLEHPGDEYTLVQPDQLEHPGDEFVSLFPTFVINNSSTESIIEIRQSRYCLYSRRKYYCYHQNA